MLPAHAEAAHERGGRLVAGVRPAVHPVQAEFPECQVQDRGRGLARIAAALRVGVEDESDLTLPVLGAAQPQRQVADHAAVLASLGSERECVVVGAQAGARHALAQELLHLRPRARLSVEVAHHIGTRAHGVEGIEVGVPERAQEQAFGFECRDERVHASIVSSWTRPAGRDIAPPWKTKRLPPQRDNIHRAEPAQIRLLKYTCTKPASTRRSSSR